MSSVFPWHRLVANLRMLARSRMTWLLLVIVGAGVASNLSAVEDKPAAPSNAAKSAKETLLREGARVEAKRAKCRVAGERLLIEFEDGRTLDALANLAAQRVFQACRDDESDSEWIVSGKITEFQNMNYLFLESVLRAPARL
ncbi:MAG: hypothetical protein SFV81_12490 [Pirellulaceae bacterium]|nr:hypothetical protein [Pirellulaceae bacterium]